MNFQLETVELESIPLPTIPGILPSSFFTEIPPNSAAIFSTNFGTRPFRPLPNPVPAHAIRSGSESDIREKSYSLFQNYPTIAESIVTPPTTWQDLYQYFDAIDLWTEGAGFLFHVLGLLVKVNLTKLRYLENWTREWAFRNEARLAKMVPCQDMLSLLQSADDHAWFDYDNMTLRDKGILNSILKWHCEAFREKHISTSAPSQTEPLQVIMEREAERITTAMHEGAPCELAIEAQNFQSVMHSVAPSQIVVEARRLPYDIPADPYQHFGKTDHKIPPGLFDRSSQSMAQHLGYDETQARISYRHQYRNRNSSQSSAKLRGSANERPYHQVSRKDSNIAGNLYFLPKSFPHFNNDQLQNPRGNYSPAYVHKRYFTPKEPVYFLNPQKSLLNLHKEAFGVQGGDFRISQVYPTQSLQNASLQVLQPYENREYAQYSNYTFPFSNDGRSHYDKRSFAFGGSARSIPQNYFKHSAHRNSWPDSNFNKVRDIVVVGFPIETSSENSLEKLFSECGEIISVNVVDEKFCAFISFKHPNSALAAINRFNGYPIDEEKFLTVRYAKGNVRRTTNRNNDVRQPISDQILRPGAHDLRPSRIHDGAYYGYDSRNPIHITSVGSDRFSSLKRPYTMPPNLVEEAQNSAPVAQAAAVSEQSKDNKSPPINLPIRPEFSFTHSTLSNSPSAVSRPHPNDVQKIFRTPDKNQHCSNNGRMSTTGQKRSVDRPVRSDRRHSYGSENSRALRKTPKKQKSLSNSRKFWTPGTSIATLRSKFDENAPLNSPTDKVSTTSVGIVSGEGTKSTCISSITSSAINSKLRKKTSAADSFLIDGTLPQQQHFSTRSSKYAQIKLSSSKSDAKSESILYTDSECNISSLHCGPCHDPILPKTITSEKLQVEAPDENSVILNGSEQPLMNHKEMGIDVDLVPRQKKKKNRNKKITYQSFDSNADTVAKRDAPPISRNYLRLGARTISNGETRPGVNTSINVGQHATASDTLSKSSDSTVLAAEKPKNKRISPGRNTEDGSSLWKGPRRQSHKPKGSTQSSQSDCIETLQDTKSAYVKNISDANQHVHGSIDIDRSPYSSSSELSPKTPRSYDVEENQTPTRKPRLKYRKSICDPKAPIQNRKENKKPVLSPAEIISDPLNWPALGSTKLQILTQAGKIQTSSPAVKPLDEHPLPPVPIRRNSMASVVAQPPQVFRRLTIDSSNSPVSGGSPLWPVVKRWDGLGKECTPSANDDGTQE